MRKRTNIIIGLLVLVAAVVGALLYLPYRGGSDSQQS